MARHRNRLVQGFLAALCVAFARITDWLPLSISRAIGRACGSLAYCLIPRVRNVGLANLDLAYGDTLNRAEKVRILKEATQNLGVVAAEFSRLPKLSGQLLAKEVKLVGIEHVDVTRGSLFIGGHIGNWEWTAAALCGYGYPIAATVRPLDHPMLDRYVDRMRRAGGILTIPKARAGAEVIRFLREGHIVGVLVDQSPRENGVPATFFGAPCWVTVAPVMAAVRARVPIHVAAMVRGPSGTYTLTVSPPLPMTRSGDLRKDLVVNTQRCQDAVEAVIRRHPGQWLWLHRRWKPRPRLEREWEARAKRRRASLNEENLSGDC